MKREYTVQMLLPFMIPDDLTYWTHDTVMCHKLTGDCSKCPMGRLSLDIECKLSAVTPVLIERIGEPVMVRKKGLWGFMGSKESRPHPGYYAEIWKYIGDNPGITASELELVFEKSRYSVHRALKYGFDAELLAREWIQDGSKGFYQWSLQREV